MSATKTDSNAHEEPSLESERRRRRPVTNHRTGRRRKLRSLATDSLTLAGFPSEFSTRHTKVRQEVGGSLVTILNRLLNTLQESGIPGPQLFRLDKEFSKQLGQGGQGNVRGLDTKVALQYRLANKRIRKIWPIERIAIKQHLERKDGHAHKARFDKGNLSSRFRAAECEVLALAPGLFHDHPNIVKLVGWGLCLDTIENPMNSCCGGLQLPLLVFERADMNFAQFLENALGESGHGRSDEARLEAGLAISGLRRSWRVSGRAVRYALKIQSEIEHDAYELVRQLCVDIGHGLKSLHENNFTHGDLKPENVLVFKGADGWTAKLCDFGCAVGQDSSVSGVHSSAEGDATTGSKQRSHTSTYLGTPGWTPPDEELEAVQDFDGLLRCDLYVYGLLVWSSFCLGGKPFSRRPMLEDMLEDVAELAASMRSPLLPSTSFERQMISQVSQLLEDTMRIPEERSLAPWACLYRQTKRKRGQATRKDRKSSLTADAPSQGSDDFKIQLNPQMKANYNDRAWWSHRGGQDRNQVLPHDDDQLEDVSKLGARADFEIEEDNEPGPASSVALDSDDNCLSTVLFHTQSRLEGSKDLPRRMISAINRLSTPEHTQDACEELYHLARFRSRVPVKWWTPFTEEGKNILQIALEASSAVDIHTLAWLCKGPIGRREAIGLLPRPWTWESIVEPDELNESERLDRFLLLLQSGAPVHMTAPSAGRVARLRQGNRGTIFEQFMDSCRPAIGETVLMQIVQRLGRARQGGLVPHSTFKYFFQKRHHRLEPGDAFSDVGVDHMDAAANVIKAIAGQTLIGRLPREEETEEPELEPHRADTETTPLLHSAVLPYGWNVVENGLAKNKSSPCYEDVFTRSVTLTKPKVSPLQMRQLTVGFLQQLGDESLSCHVDLLACLRAGSGPNELSEFANDLEKRFPYYDDAWFAAEWNTEPNTVDVLQALTEPWRIRTFTSRLKVPEADVWKTAGLVGVGVGLAGLFSAALAAGVLYLIIFLNIQNALLMSIYTSAVFLVLMVFTSIAFRTWRKDGKTY